MARPFSQWRINYLCTYVSRTIKMAPSLVVDGGIVRANLGATHTTFKRKNAPWLASNVFCRRIVGGFRLGQLAFLGNWTLWYHFLDRLARFRGHPYSPRFRFFRRCVCRCHHLALSLRPIFKTSIASVHSFQFSVMACPSGFSCLLALFLLL